MTAPYKRNTLADSIGAHLRRTRSLEANPPTQDAELFDFWIPSADYPLQDQIVSVGGAAPSFFTLQSFGYVTGNLIANVWFAIATGGIATPFNPGSGSQYLIALPSYDSSSDGGPQSRYVPGWRGLLAGLSVASPIGWGTSESGGSVASMGLRVSSVDYNTGTGNAFLEAYDSSSGALWGPSSPFAWGTGGDLLLGGFFSYPLDTSLLDAAYPAPDPGNQ